MVARVKAHVGLIRRPGFWHAADSLTLGKAHRGLVIKRVRDNHLDENDQPFRPYTPRYREWKRGWLSADKAHKVQTLAQQLSTKKRPGKKALAALEAAKAAFDLIPSSGTLPVDLTLTGRHLDGLAVVEYDEAGWVLSTDAVNAKGGHYSAWLQVNRPHMDVSPSDARALTGIALRIIRSRARGFKGGAAPEVSYLPTIIEAAADQIRNLAPTRQRTQPFEVPDIEEGPVTPILARLGMQSRICEIRIEAGPGDDGACGVSDRHRADLTVSIGYSTQDRMRWHDAIRAEDCEAVQGILRDPSWWPVGTYSIEVLDPATHLAVDDNDREVGRIVSIPITIRYESEP